MTSYYVITLTCKTLSPLINLGCAAINRSPPIRKRSGRGTTRHYNSCHGAYQSVQEAAQALRDLPITRGITTTIESREFPFRSP